MQTWFLLLVSVLCWGGWAVTEKLSVKYMSPFMVQMIGAYIYSALAPILFLYMKATNIPMVWNAKGVLWSSVTCILAASAGISFAIVLQKIDAHVAVGITSIYPIVTFALCYLFLNEEITITKLFGITLIVCGTIMIGTR